jgi:UDP-N-acetylglucosamine--N-acetylmuramyl-(pentapeptide) pyrophosphoryl-undecaprenol N-acetylglucosamine transferase
MKIILTGGGTAGHIWPIVSLCKELKSREIDYLYIGSKGSLEEKIAHNNEVNFRAVSAGKMRNYFSLLNIIDPFKIFFGIIEAYFLINKYKPDVVFSKGGYVAVPVLFWAKKMKIPTVLHESDAVIGKATRWGSDFAQKICTGFPVENYDLGNLPKEKFVFTGVPLRSDFLQKIDLPKSSLQTILVTGGSQGSSKINNTVSEILTELLENYRVIHLTGERDFSTFYKIKNPNYEVFAFSLNMPQLLEVSDLVVTRSGSTLAEISFLAKAAILIPLATSSLDHQKANADFYGSHNAAEVIYEKDLTSMNLLFMIKKLMSDDAKRLELGKNIKALARPDAVSDIVDILEKVAK